MTGLDIYKKAAFLTGDSLSDSQIGDEAVFAVNEIGKDLCDFEEIEKIGDTVKASKAVTDVMPYGVAMIYTMLRGETARNEFFCNIYSGKRAALKGTVTQVTDKLPVASGDAV